MSEMVIRNVLGFKGGVQGVQTPPEIFFLKSEGKGAECIYLLLDLLYWLFLIIFEKFFFIVYYLYFIFWGGGLQNFRGV